MGGGEGKRRGGERKEEERVGVRVCCTSTHQQSKETEDNHVSVKQSGTSLFWGV